MKKLICKICEEKTPHRLLFVTRFLTKWRTLVRRTYRCSLCNNVRINETQKKNEKVQILD